jgi:hypothetical protein
MTTKAKPKTTKAVAQAKPKSDLIWAGASKLLDKSQNKEVQKEKNSILVYSKALGVSPFGITVLGGICYVNKNGRKKKMDDYLKADKQEGTRIEYRWIQRAKDDNSKAICEAFLVDKDGKRVSAKITGEASPTTMKMGTLAGYQNHLAQTRAHNRLIEEVYGNRIHEELVEGVGEIMKAKNQPTVMPIETGVSPEEMQPEIPQITEKTDFKKQLKERLHEAGAKTEEQALAILKEKTGLVWTSTEDKTETQYRTAIAKLIIKK